MKAKRSVAAKRFLVLFGASAKKNSPRKAVPLSGADAMKIVKMIAGKLNISVESEETAADEAEQVA